MSQSGNKALFEEFVDFYELLNVKEDATNSEISNAFRQRALKYHPDKNKSPEATVKFMEYKRAQLTLLDPEARSTFDNVRKYRMEAIKREKQDDLERRTLKKELLEKERLYRQEQEAFAEAKLRAEMEKLSKRNAMASSSKNSLDTIKIRVKYRNPLKSGPLDIDSLKNAFLPYGTIDLITISGNCAIIEFDGPVQNGLLERGQYDDEALQLYSIDSLNSNKSPSSTSDTKSSLRQLELATAQRIKELQQRKRSSQQTKESESFNSITKDK